MNVAVLELVEHALYGPVIVCERFAYACRQAGIVDEFTQTLASQCQVIVFLAAAIGISRRLFSGPAPFWQRGERPLQYVH